MEFPCGEEEEEGQEGLEGREVLEAAPGWVSRWLTRRSHSAASGRFGTVQWV